MGEAQVDGLEAGVQYYFFLYDNQGGYVASNQVYCQGPPPERPSAAPAS
jgi:hypothetical protein